MSIMGTEMNINLRITATNEIRPLLNHHVKPQELAPLPAASGPTQGMP